MIIERRCLSCDSTNGTPGLNGREYWYSFEVPSGRASPFCRVECIEDFANWDRYTQMAIIYGTARKGLGFLSGISKFTRPLDCPYIYPAEPEGSRLQVGPGRVYLHAGWIGEEPLFEEYLYQAVSA